MNLHSPGGQPMFEKETENHSSSQQEIYQKFVINVPKNVEEALAFNKENGNDLWWKAIQKEMSAVKVAFKIIDDEDKPPIGCQYMKCLNQDGGVLQKSMPGCRRPYG